MSSIMNVIESVLAMAWFCLLLTKPFGLHDFSWEFIASVFCFAMAFFFMNGYNERTKNRSN